MSALSRTRRSALGAGLLAAAGAWASPRPRTTADGEGSPLPLPPEAGALLSSGYGRARVKKVQKALTESGLDGLLVSNRALGYIQHVTNFFPIALQPGLAFVPAEGQPTLFVHTYSPVHARALRGFVWIEDLVDVPRDARSEGSDLGLYRECLARLRTLKLDRARLGVAGEEVDWLLPAWFREQAPGLRLEDAGGLLSRMVVVKDDVELALMRHAQRLIDEIAYPVYREVLRPGAWDTSAYARVSEALLAAGADPFSMLLFDAGPAGSGTWSAGVRRRRLERGDVVLSEPMPSVLGYQAEKELVFVIGKDVPGSQKRGADVVHEAFLMGMAEFRVGEEIAPVVEKVVSFMKGRGYEGPTVPIGHWIGAQNHEGPRFTPEGLRGWRLEPGMVVSWHPNLVVPGEVRACSSVCFVATTGAVKPLSKLEVRPMEFL